MVDPSRIEVARLVVAVARRGHLLSGLDECFLQLSQNVLSVREFAQSLKYTYSDVRSWTYSDF